MATSGSSNHSITAGTALTRAFRMIRRLGQSATLPGELSSTGLAVLNLYVKSLRNRGVLLSSLFQDSFAVVADTATYTLAPRTLSISAVRFRPTNGSDRELFELSREEYLRIPNKTSSGDPSQFYVDKQRDSTVMYLWSVPASVSGAIHYSGERIIEDLDATTDDFDLDTEYLEPIVWNLAARLAPEFTNLGDPSIQFIIAKAEEMEADMLAASRPAFYSLVPDLE